MDEAIAVDEALGMRPAGRTRRDPGIGARVRSPLTAHQLASELLAPLHSGAELLRPRHHQLAAAIPGGLAGFGVRPPDGPVPPALSALAGVAVLIEVGGPDGARSRSIIFYDIMPLADGGLSRERTWLLPRKLVLFLLYGLFACILSLQILFKKSLMCFFSLDFNRFKK